MKKYSLRIEVNFSAGNNDDAKRLAGIFLKELPHMEGLSVKNVSVYNCNDKRVIDSDNK